MAAAPALDIVRLTPDWVAVNKAVGMAAIPEQAGDQACLLARLESLLGGNILVVHRLDKEVSGVILYARNGAAHRFLNMAFERREVKKLYAAGALGEIRAETGEIDFPLREFGSGRIGVDRVKGKPCLTRWRVRERKPGRTLLDMEPFTGRRHQLRAHAYAIGHPLMGDSRYGDKAVQAAYPRLLLHARLLDFPAPEGGRVVVECPPDALFLETWHGS